MVFFALLLFVAFSSLFLVLIPSGLLDFDDLLVFAFALVFFVIGGLDFTLALFPSMISADVRILQYGKALCLRFVPDFLTNFGNANILVSPIAGSIS